MLAPSTARCARHREHAQGLREMRLVEHPALELDGTRTAGALERLDNGARVTQFFLVGHVALVDQVDLVRMDRDLAGEAGATRRANLALQPLAIPKVRGERVDGL